MSNEYNLKQYLLEAFETNNERYRVMTSFNLDEKKEYSTLLSQLKEFHDPKNQNANSTIKGKALENIVLFLFEKTAVFDVKENIHTSSNEIDHLITLNALGRRFKNDGFLELHFDIFLSECKNYNKPVSVTWVGKFFSLMHYTKTHLGLLFSYHGLSGSGWNDAMGLTKKIYLSSSSQEPIYILDFNIKDFENIEKGSNLLEIIAAKVKALQIDTKFEHFIEKHPAEISKSS